MGKMKNQFTQVQDLINVLVDYTAYAEVLSFEELESRAREAVDNILGDGWFDRMVFQETGVYE